MTGMLEREFVNMREAYPVIAKDALYYGIRSAPRGLATREILNYTFSISDPTDSLPLGVNRSLSIPFAAMEAIQLISGESQPELLTKINPTMRRFLSERESSAGVPITYQHGAYGPRIGPYVQKVVNKLEEDRDSRQALLNIWNQERDYASEPDIPCTVSLHFMIRDDKLVLVTNMRSNDVWWGTAYDVFQFTQLQLTIANILQIEAGTYHHHANSFHMYERDQDSIMSLKEADDPQQLRVLGIDGAFDVDAVQARASKIMTAASSRIARPHIEYMTPSEEWYYSQLLYESDRSE